MKLKFYFNKYKHSREIIMRYFTFVMMIVLFGSCNVYKNLGEDEKLINHHKIDFVETENDIQDANNLKYNLKNIARPRANRKSFGVFRNRLSAYYRTKEDRDYGWYKTWLKKSIAEPPAIYDTSHVVENVQRMTNYLHDLGYWNSIVTSEVKEKKHTVNIAYKVELNAPFKVKEINIFSKDQGIDSLLQVTDHEKVFKYDALLSNDNYQKEVERISTLLRDNGYAAFLPSVYVDKLRGDTLGNYRLEVFLVEDSIAHQKYHIGNIDVYLDEPSPANTYANQDTIGNIVYHYNKDKPYIKPKLIDKKIEIRPGELYRKRNVDDTRVLLGDVAIFNRTPITNQVRDSSNIIDYTMHLRRRLRYGWNTDITTGYTIITNQNRIGFSGAFGFTDRNAFRGGEVFTTQIRGGLEFDLLSSGPNGLISTDLQFNNSLNIPAFKDIYGSYRFLRRIGLLNDNFYREIRRKGTTTIGANVQFLAFKDFYSYQNYEIELGHKVKYKNIQYNITQTGINFWKPKTTTNFDTTNQDNPNLLASFDPRILTGLFFRRLDLTYFSKPSQRGNQFGFLGSIDASGHEVFLANAIYRLATNSNSVFDLGTVNGDTLKFAQFFKFQLDGRYTKRVDFGSTLTSRAFFGLAIPYGFTRGTNVVPYVSQFSVGGPFSIRGWEARELGPGSSTTSDSLNNPTSFAQKGDLKIELNLEFRTRLFWYLHGALFVDAGNVWALDKNQTPSNEVFTSRFYEQIAIAAGYGLRFDYDNLFVIRLDLGYKLRQANNDPIEGNWIYDQLKLGNANFNFAVGYPF